MIKIPSNDTASRELVSKINTERKKSDRLTVAKLNTISKPYKQDYKSKLMMKHLDFEIQAVNTIRPPDIEYTQKSQPLGPVDTPLLIIRKHIPRQSDINKIVKSIETCVIHGLE